MLCLHMGGAVIQLLSDPSESGLTSNHADHDRLSDEGVCVFISPVLLCGAQLLMPDEDLH